MGGDAASFNAGLIDVMAWLKGKPATASGTTMRAKLLSGLETSTGRQRHV